MKNLVLIVIGLIAWQTGRSQYNRPRYYEHKSHSSSFDEGKGSFGAGIGLDYGGLGIRYTYIPEQHVAAFASAGFALAGVGYNVGAMARFQPERKFVPTISAMYGYNGAIYVKGSSDYSKLYYGPSVGVGLITRLNKIEGNYWHFELIVPFRSSDFNNDLNVIKNNASIKITTQPLPVLFSIGYHFSMQ